MTKEIKAVIAELMLKGNALPAILTVIFTIPWQEYDSNKFFFTIFDNSIEKQDYIEELQKEREM